MIRQGKQQGWLTSSISTIGLYAKINNIETKGVSVGKIPGRGTALLSSRDVSADQNPLLCVPKELILSKDTVWLYAKSDKYLNLVLDACGDFAQSARHSILIFLLVQATYSCPSLLGKIGVQNALRDYIKFLPLELLPTFWTEEELYLAKGTTLLPATEAKMNSLYREYEEFQRLTSQVTWCQEFWWDDVEGVLEFDDWKQVDAMYRSRALEFPEIADCMVPYIDFANHASGDSTNAFYEADRDGNALLKLLSNKTVQQNHEVTITYGDEKGACEMIFSYGFLEDSADKAHMLFLDIHIPDDDPLKMAKQTFATCAPGVRLAESRDRLIWESEYVWLLILNEEDGLEFSVVQTNSGAKKLQARWCGEMLTDTSSLEENLRGHPLWNIFQLRAITVLDYRVDDQLQALSESAVEFGEVCSKASDNIREIPRSLTQRLRVLEQGLLTKFSEYFDSEKARLVQSESVQNYLQSQRESMTEEDFS